MTLPWHRVRDSDPLRRAWDELVLPQVDAYDRDHYETVWNAVVRRGPTEAPYGASVGIP